MNKEFYKTLPKELKSLYKQGLITKEELEVRLHKGYSELLTAYLVDYHNGRMDRLIASEKRLRKFYPSMVRTGRGFRLDPIIREIIREDLNRVFTKKFTLEEEQEMLRKLF